MDFEKVHWKDDGSRIRFKVIPSFVSKTQLATSAPISLEVPALTDHVGPSESEDLKLCPVRAVRLYLDKTKNIRKGKKLLFVSYQKNFPKDIASSTISFWIKKCIKMCYELHVAEVPTDPTFKIKAHDVRAFAASLADMSKVPLQDVMEACSWSSHNTFTSFYLRDLSWADADGLRL